AGQNALVQTIPAAAAGAYTVVVSGAGGTTGLYTVQLTLNAALENEGTLSGVSDDTIATAQPIDAAFTSLSPTEPTTARGAIIGSIQGGGTNLVTNGSFEPGNFTGWTTVSTGTPYMPWAVSGAGVGGGYGMLTTAPQDGTYDAWNGFDGAGPMQYT